MNTITPYAITPEKMAEIQRAMENAAKDIEEVEKREREAPRTAFFASAHRAGFSAAQAEFMWEYLAIHDRRLKA